MPRGRRYDVDAAWDDPFERREDRRTASRFDLPFKVSIAVDGPEHKGRFIGPGLTLNMSVSGVAVKTKHSLEPGQHVNLSIPTHMCPNSMFFPEAFVGPAEVIRVVPQDERRRTAALQFGDTFANSMDFARFVGFLETAAESIGAAH